MSPVGGRTAAISDECHVVRQVCPEGHVVSCSHVDNPRPSVHYSGVASKYDSYWQQRAALIGDLVDAAAQNERAMADFSAIAVLGDRGSWSGSATVRGGSVLKASMAHMVSLGRQLATSGVCCS